MNLTKEDQDLLEKAERDYPALTRFKLGEFECTVYPESIIIFDPSPEYKGNLLCNTGGCIYDASTDRWAEILPNESDVLLKSDNPGIDEYPKLSFTVETNDCPSFNKSFSECGALIIQFDHQGQQYKTG